MWEVQRVEGNGGGSDKAKTLRGGWGYEEGMRRRGGGVTEQSCGRRVGDEKRGSCGRAALTSESSMTTPAGVRLPKRGEMVGKR